MHVWSRPRPLPAGFAAAALFTLVLLAVALLAYTGMHGSIVVLVGLVGLAVVIATLCDWTVGVPLLLIVGSSDGFLKHYSASPAMLVLKDALLGLILIGLGVWLAIDRKNRADTVRWRGAIAWGVYLGFMLTQVLHAAGGSFSTGIAAFRAHGMFSLLFVVGAIYFRKRERLGKLANFAIVVLTCVAASAILQHALGAKWMTLSPGFMKASLHYASFASAAARAAGSSGDAIYRMYGTLVDPASLGVACAYGVLFAVAALARLRGIRRVLAICAIPLMGTALLLSQSRASMGGLALGLVVLISILGMRKATRGFALAGLFLIVAAVPMGMLLTNGSVADRVLQPDQVAYAQGTRDEAQRIVINEGLTNPFGHGLGATGAGGGLRADPGLAVDNVFFANFYETGFLGLALFIFVQVSFMVLGVRAFIRAKDVGAQTAFAGIVAGQIALFVSCWFSQGGFDYAPLAQFFWLFAGAVARQDAWA